MDAKTEKELKWQRDGVVYAYADSPGFKHRINYISYPSLASATNRHQNVKAMYL